MTRSCPACASHAPVGTWIRSHYGDLAMSPRGTAAAGRHAASWPWRGSSRPAGSRWSRSWHHCRAVPWGSPSGPSCLARPTQIGAERARGTARCAHGRGGRPACPRRGSAAVRSRQADRLPNKRQRRGQTPGQASDGQGASESITHCACPARRPRQIGFAPPPPPSALLLLPSRRPLASLPKCEDHYAPPVISRHRCVVVVHSYISVPLPTPRSPPPSQPSATVIPSPACVS
jgi:hypothetical protein